MAWFTKVATVGAPVALNPVPPKDATFSYNVSQKYSVAQFDAQFVTVKLPAASKYVYDDDYFAFLRVGGFHPIVIEKVVSLPSKFPMTDALLHTAPGFETDSLASMIQQGRLFIADYKVLNSLVPGTNPVQKFVYCPIGLFGMTQTGG